MALDNTKLKASGSNALSLTNFVYRTNDTLATVLGNDYFNDQAERLPVGSLITVRYDEDGTPGVAILTVTVNTGTDVTVANEFFAATADAEV